MIRLPRCRTYSVGIIEKQAIYAPSNGLPVDVLRRTTGKLWKNAELPPWMTPNPLIMLALDGKSAWHAHAFDFPSAFFAMAAPARCRPGPEHPAKMRKLMHQIREITVACCLMVPDKHHIGSSGFDDQARLSAMAPGVDSSRRTPVHRHGVPACGRLPAVGCATADRYCLTGRHWPPDRLPGYRPKPLLSRPRR